MFDYKIVDNQELSNISGGGLGGDVVVGALVGCISGRTILYRWRPSSLLDLRNRGRYSRWHYSFWIETPKIV